MNSNANGPALLAELERSRVLAILRGLPPDAVILGVRALVRGGIRLVEVTADSPEWEESIQRLVDGEATGSEAIRVGAGTILTGDLATRAHRAGATFLVSPIVEAEVSDYAREVRLGYVPGALSPAEIYAAHRAGATCVKVFPADAFGSTYIARLLQPMPFLKLLPTGGVTLESAAGYVTAGAIGVALGGSLVEPGSRLGALQATEARARQLVAAVHAG